MQSDIPFTSKKKWWETIKGQEAISFYLFILPWLISFILLTLGPILASFILGFMSYDMALPPRWIGLVNFKELFQDKLFYKSLANTLYIVILAVPLSMIAAFGMALLLNQKIHGQAFYRTAYYIPSIVPAVASAALWLYVLQPQWGLMNAFLEKLGIPGPGWLASEVWSKPAIIMLMVWSSGGNMIIYLAGLQDIPKEYYEASQIDGANTFGQFLHVTLPLMTPTIFFTVIMGIISTFQVFSSIFVLTDGMGGPVNSTLVYLIYLYRNAFAFFRMGYSSAMAWVLFLLILGLTILNFRMARYWVHYESGNLEA